MGKRMRIKRALKTEMDLENSLARPKTRLQRVRAYEKEIDKIYKKINILQERCNHKNTLRKPKSNTGNWDPNDDRYWWEIDCMDCKKHWQEDQ